MVLVQSTEKSMGVSVDSLRLRSGHVTLNRDIEGGKVSNGITRATA